MIMRAFPRLLRFDDPVLEREFVRRYDLEHRQFVRLGCGLSMIVWLSVSLMARSLGIPHAQNILILTFLGIFPTMLLAAGATFTRRLIGLWQGLAAAANVITALMLIHVSRQYYLDLVFLTAGMILMFVYAIFIFRLRMRYALPSVFGYLLVAQAVLADLGLPDHSFIISSSLTWGALVATSLGGYFLESAIRRLFLSTRLLAQRNREIEADLVIAHRIVDTLLPGDVGAMPGLVVHAAYRPMDQVGGDFYDIHRRDGRLDLFIADVSGHGLASSYLALVTRLSLDRVDRHGTPAPVLESLNGLVRPSAVNGSFVTAFYATVDPAAQTVAYAAAGHHAALLLRRATGTVERLAARGRPLGWFAECKAEERRARVAPGDRLVIYTDGVTECRRPDGDLYGEERLEEFLRRTASLDAAGMTTALMNELSTFCARRSFDDDVTVLVADLVP